jgi:hypothetical protein
LPTQERLEGKHIKSEALFKKVKDAIDAKKWYIWLINLN